MSSKSIGLKAGHESVPQGIHSSILQKLQSDVPAKLHLFHLDLGKLQKPLRVVTMDRTTLRNKILSSPENAALEQYPCQIYMSTYEETFNGFLTVYEGSLLFSVTNTGDTYSCSNIASIQPISPSGPPDVSSQFPDTQTILYITVAGQPDNSWFIAPSDNDLSDIQNALNSLIQRIENYTATLASKIEQTPLGGHLYNGFTLTKKLTLTGKDKTLDYFSTEESAPHRELPYDQISDWTVIVKSIGNDVPVIIRSCPPKSASIMDNIKELSFLICKDSDRRHEKAKGNDSGSDTEVTFNE